VELGLGYSNADAGDDLVYGDEDLVAVLADDGDYTDEMRAVGRPKSEVGRKTG
jgi:hypothetical protein